MELNRENKLYDRVYTIGCFDWLHDGHIKLLAKLKGYGKRVIVGIHDDRSIEQLKNLSPDEHQTIDVRMKNVKKYVDFVYVIPDKDPTLFLECVLQEDDNKDNACFIRADDMPNFPGRKLIENRISIMFLPYTEGISSTMIRKDMKK